MTSVSCSLGYFNAELPKPLSSGTGCLLPAGGCCRRRRRPSTATPAAVDALYGRAGPQAARSWTCGTCTRRRSCPCAGCWRRWSWPAAGWTPGPWRPSGRCWPTRAAELEQADLRPGRGGIQHQLPQAAGGDPLRQAGPAPRQEDQDRLVHQRRRAGKAPATRPPSWGRCWSTGSTPS